MVEMRTVRPRVGLEPLLTNRVTASGATGSASRTCCSDLPLTSAERVQAGPAGRVSVVGTLPPPAGGTKTTSAMLPSKADPAP